MKRFVLALFAFASSVACAQTPSESVETFLQRVATPESDSAVEKLFAGSGIIQLKPQTIITFKGQIKMAMGLYGTQTGIEKVREDDISPSLKRLIYIQKFEDLPVAWEFYFYKRKDMWVINTLNFRDEVGLIVGSTR